ncbi:MAG: hypothetical protein K1X72_28805 [Pyrinomonadaceae bacterium]|nr:hypothetical protein [Pyrinomonadaceae bacterium]
MKFSNIKTFVIFLVLAVTTLSANAQNSLNSPQRLSEYQTAITFNGDNRESYYSFVGKGDVTVTLDVKALSGNAGVYVDFLNAKGKKLSEMEVVQAQNRGTDRIVKDLSLGNKFQTIILKVKSIAYGSQASYPGNLKISLDGEFDGMRSSGGTSSTEDIDFEKTINLDWTGNSIDNPRMLTTRYSVLNFRGDNKEEFLAFYGQEKIEITYDVKANNSNAGTYLTLLDKNGDNLSSQGVAQAMSKGTSRITQSIELNKRQLVIIKIVSIAYGSNSSYPGTLKITLNRGFAL